MFIQVSKPRAAKASDSTGVGVNRQLWAIQVGGWKTNSDPVTEQSTFLITEPSFQLQNQRFYLKILNILIQEITLEASNILTVSPV